MRFAPGVDALRSGQLSFAPANPGVPAYLGARRLRDAGCKMAIGVSRRTWLRPLILGRLSSRAWQQQGCRELVADHRLVDAGGPAGIGSSSGFERDVADFAKGVVAAACELASDSDEGDVSIEPLTKPLVVGVVR